MSRRLRQLSGKRLPDAAADDIRREHHEAIAELQRIAARTGVVLSNVSLADGVETPIAHGLGRTPTIIKTGCPRGAVTAGVITEVRRDAELIVLQADDFGASIRVEIEVA